MKGSIDIFRDTFQGPRAGGLARPILGILTGTRPEGFGRAPVLLAPGFGRPSPPPATHGREDARYAKEDRTGGSGGQIRADRLEDGDAFCREEMTMLQRSCLLSVIMAAACTTAAVADGDEARPNDLPGWGRVIDPWRDCDISLDRENDRLNIRVPGTPHVLSAEVPQLPMNAPRVVRGVRGDFTANVRVLGQLEPGRSRTTHYNPYHGAGLIVWQDPSNYLRLERAVGTIDGRHHPYVNYELREGGLLAVTRGFTIGDGTLYLKLRRQGNAFSAWYSFDGRRWVGLGGSTRPSTIRSRSASSPSTPPV